jgi:hypothetical protein
MRLLLESIVELPRTKVKKKTLNQTFELMGIVINDFEKGKKIV